jgi:methionine-rich copper-binding protein CopC
MQRRFRFKRAGRAFLLLTAACAAAAAGSTAAAHAHLVTAHPAADSKTAEVSEVRLVFSESIEPRLSTIRLENSEERTVTEPAAEVDSAQPRELAVHLFEKLPPGIYKVRWAVVAADGHRMSGSFAFLVSR